MSYTWPEHQLIKVSRPFGCDNIAGLNMYHLSTTIEAPQSELPCHPNWRNGNQK